MYLLDKEFLTKIDLWIADVVSTGFILAKLAFFNKQF